MTISIKKMRDNFVPEDRFFSVKDKNVRPITDEISTGINCYALAVGCLCPGKEGEDYIPGFTENSPYESKADLPEKICLDLANWGKNFRKLNIFGPLDLKENEYLIKVFYSDPTKDHPRGNFHLIRQNKETKIWYHKLGFYNQPVLAQIVGFPEDHDPEELIFLDEKTKQIIYYYPICYFAIEK